MALNITGKIFPSGGIKATGIPSGPPAFSGISGS